MFAAPLLSSLPGRRNLVVSHFFGNAIPVARPGTQAVTGRNVEPHVGSDVVDAQTIAIEVHAPKQELRFRIALFGCLQEPVCGLFEFEGTVCGDAIEESVS
mgnify:CR=1 FL=1